ncbi:MAG TPA: hypothetical protein VID30_10715 [Bradyrhizobium sp.]
MTGGSYAAGCGGQVAADITSGSWHDARGSLIKTDSLYNLCFPVQTAPSAVCQNGVMDSVLHPIEPLTMRITVAGAF